MSEPLDLDAIKATVGAYHELQMPPHAHMREMAEAIEALVAEVERLRAIVLCLMVQIDQEFGVEPMGDDAEVLASAYRTHTGKRIASDG